MTTQRRARLAMIAIAFVFALSGAVFRVVRDPDPVATLLLMAVAGAATATGIFWVAYRQQESALRGAIERNQAVGGVPCAIALDAPAWGSLVITPNVLVWEPNDRARANGRTTVHLGERGRASADFHKVRLGLRDWSAVTFTAPDREPFTAAMSKSSAERLKRLLAASPSDSTHS